MALAPGATTKTHRARRSSLSVMKPRQEKPLDRTQGIQDSDYRVHSKAGESLGTASVLLDSFDYERLEGVEFLASGAFSHVFSARYEGQSVVVKLLREQYKDSHVTLKQMRFEQTLLSQLQHPGIVGFIGTGIYQGVPFTVLERLDDTLNHRITGEERLSMMECLAHAKAVGEALVYLHENALPGQIVLHRDLKPDNLAFNEAGAIKLIDFGLARSIPRGSSIDEVYEMTGETGSLRYMAPEVALGMMYNAKADVYSLSLILWQMVQGAKPFQGMSRKDFFHHVVHRHFRPPIDPKWPAALSTLITRSWEPDHTKRPTAREFVAAIDALMATFNRHRRNSTGNSSSLARVRSVFQMMRERAGEYVLPAGGRRGSRVDETDEAGAAASGTTAAEQQGAAPSSPAPQQQAQPALTQATGAAVVAVIMQPAPQPQPQHAAPSATPSQAAVAGAVGVTGAGVVADKAAEAETAGAPQVKAHKRRNSV